MSDLRPYFPPGPEYDFPVFVAHRPRRRYWLHALFFGLTIFTTLVVGARLQHNFNAGLPAYAVDHDYFPFFWALAEPSRLLLGVPFSFTLLAILLAHEMGHFVYAVRHRVFATLPFFIPAPTLIGTFGAFIRIKSSIPSRTALFDIGIAGPIAGFIVAVPAAAVGLALSVPMPATAVQSSVVFHHPLIFQLVQGALETFGAPVAGISLASVYMHPVAVAAWIGMFATSLNLIPGGQLDGGHIVYSVLPFRHKLVSRLTMFALVPLGILFWNGWLFWAALLLLTGVKHPMVPVLPPLDRKRRALAWLAVLMMLLTFWPEPLTIEEY